jgi:hypothetical protein
MTMIRCTCGALYERTEEKISVRDLDSFRCEICGSVLERWSYSRVPHYRLISAPSDQENNPSPKTPQAPR